MLTLLLNAMGNSRQTELGSATKLDSMSVGEFLAQNENGSAIYTGTIKAVDPVSIRQESGEYISLHRKVEQVEKIYDKEKDKYETDTKTISDKRGNCDEIEIDGVVVRYSSFHDLPSYEQTDSEGADSNLRKTTFSYTPASVDGTFFLKCKNGEVYSVQYFKSEDIAGESKKAFDIARIIIWAVIIVIEIYLIYDIIKTSKAIKLRENRNLS